MREYLYRIDDPTDTYSRGLNPDERAFLKASYALYLARPAPAAQAAVLEAVSRIPGVTLVADATDVAGRHGVAVARSGETYRDELVFDPGTYVRTAIVDRTGQLP